MGAYINPPNMSKEEWLFAYGKSLTPEQAKDHNDYENNFLVVYVSNGAYGAAAICFNENEKNRFLDPSDLRPKAYSSSQGLYGCFPRKAAERSKRKIGIRS